MSQVHVYALPDEGVIREDSALCSEDPDAFVVYHVDARKNLHDDDWTCWACGVTSGKEGSLQ